MKESFWSIMIIMLGIVSVAFIYFFQTVSTTDEQNYTLIKEVTEAAMYDAIDLAAYKKTGEIRIDREKFVENFIRRFAENASLSRTYLIQIYDVNEVPPKVSIKVSSSETGTVNNEVYQFDIINKLDAILETPY